MATRSSATKAVSKAAFEKLTVSIKKSRKSAPSKPDKGGYVKPRPAKAGNARQAKELDRLNKLEQIEKQKVKDAADPKSAAKRKAIEDKELARLEAARLKPVRQPYVAVYADFVCDKISEGQDLREVLRCIGVSFPSFCDWMRKVPSFGKAFAIARENAAHLYVSQIITMADTSVPGQIVTDDPKGTTVVTKDMIERSKLGIDSRKWVASKILSKLYGDKIVHTGDADNPIVTQMVRDADELVKLIRGGG